MNEKKFVTLEMFEKYHELLVGSIDADDDLETIASDECDKHTEDDEVENV